MMTPTGIPRTPTENLLPSPAFFSFFLVISDRHYQTCFEMNADAFKIYSKVLVGVTLAIRSSSFFSLELILAGLCVSQEISYCFPLAWRFTLYKARGHSLWRVTE